jgi:two-component system sensor histidine kinase HydH
MGQFVLVGSLVVASFAAGVAGGIFIAWLRRRPAGYSPPTASRKRFAELELVAAGLAHEIRNPLSILNLNLGLLAEDLAGLRDARTESLQKKVDTLRSETKRLEGVLNDFLRYARGGELELETVDLNDVVDQVLDFASAEAAGRKIQVRKGLAEGLPRVKADAARLKQALLNVVLNAHDAMPDGGELIVQTRAGSDGVRLTVTDTGTGIDPEVLHRIFDVYYSTKSGGTGLGLATTRRIIEGHGGSISVESEPGRGTRFTVRLPAAAPETRAADEESDSA